MRKKSVPELTLLPDGIESKGGIYFLHLFLESHSPSPKFYNKLLSKTSPDNPPVSPKANKSDSAFLKVLRGLCLIQMMGTCETT